MKMMQKRYLGIDKNGIQETPVDMLLRVANSLASVEKDYGYDETFVRKTAQAFFDVMANKEFTPAGRTMTNAGADTPIVANCIVLEIEDSLEGIFQTLKEAALLQQKGAGLGFALDRLRPAMSAVVTTKGSSSGPVSFLKIYNEAFGIIKQQGRTGANMAMISVDHPDVLDFIRSKEVEGEIRNFNISVKVTDEFMKKVVESPDEQWYCTWKKEWPGGSKKVKPHKILRHPNGVVYDVADVDITVGEIFDEIVNYAWTNGEPGIVFIDEVNRTNPLPGLGPIETSNPCGEQFLHPNDNCNLGSINLSAFVKNGKFDYKRLEKATEHATRMLDNVIDRFDFPVKAITDMAKRNRRIGLGIMGFADALYQLGVKYNSKEGYKLAEKMMETIQKASYQTSRDLAKDKGAFPNYKKSIYAKGVKVRNAARTTVAPTGSISMMYDTSSGVEPNFALSFIKQDKDGEQYVYLNKYFAAELEARKFSQEEIEKIKEEVVRTGSIQHLDELPQDLRDTFVVSMDIAGGDHVKMQAAFQKHVDNSISKTINFANSATKDDIKESYIQAWKLGCKSCTVYRDGSRTIQVLNIGESGDITSLTEDPKNTKRNNATVVETKAVMGGEVQSGITPRTRPDSLVGKTYRLKTGYGKLYVTVNNDEYGRPFEVFATIGKSGGFFQEQSEAICRMISLALRSGIELGEILDNLKGIRGPMPVMTENGTILSLPDGIGKVLEEHLGVTRPSSVDNISIDISAEIVEEEKITVGAPKQLNQKHRDMADYGFMPGCPDCGTKLVMEEGCVSCKNCGYSRCM
ncbi:MAG: Ribonucleoside-diphosphate reductase [Parcubacteria group bacterium GW2011_GWB1_45_7]|nr:MAG: Ribonucleoside-diphosphate reductase [Parcubacteria group bacterium GW2011_GWB1_45_7]